jgi:hypothetical protein
LGFFFGSTAIILIALFGLWLSGLLKYFYDWAINFGIFILPVSQGQIQIAGIRTILICLFPFLSFIPLLFMERKKHLPLLVWAISGAMSAYPRFEYFHLLPGIPFISMASAILFSKFQKNTVLKFYSLIYILGLIYLFMSFFIRSYREGVRFYIKDNSAPGDRIFVLNWWENLYALTDTLPAVTPLVPQLEWYQEMRGIQEAEVESLKLRKAKMVIVKPYTQSGLASYIPKTLYGYLKENYNFKTKIGGIEIWVPKK